MKDQCLYDFYFTGVEKEKKDDALIAEKAAIRHKLQCEEANEGWEEDDDICLRIEAEVDYIIYQRKNHGL